MQKEDWVVLWVALAVLVTLMTGAITWKVTTENFKTAAIAHGHAEYVVIEDNGIAWRWK